MSLDNHYYYNEEKCEFFPVEYSRGNSIIYTTCLWILNGVVLAGIGLILLSNYVGTPAEIALKAENETLIEQMHQAQESISMLENQMETIAEMDNEMYRSVLGLDPISTEERRAGIGGSDPYAEFDIHSEEASEILRWTASQIDNLERRIGIQRISFDEIKGYYNNNQELLSHLPAIKPTEGILLSGFGMRVHPVLKYRRMHEGLDFRADVGTPVYATGNATVKITGRRSTYGLMVVLNHTQGFETRYAHLSGFADGIRPGAEINRGDLIGYTGNTGMTQGPHLHYEIRIDGKPVDPMYYLISDTSPEEYMMYQDIASSNPMSMD